MADDDERFVPIDHHQLSDEARRGLIEEFITREGTEYGHAEHSLDDKVKQVEQQLDQGEARIVYDTAEECANIVPADFLKKKKSIGET